MTVLSRTMGAALFALWPLAALAEPGASLIHFTEDGTEAGAPLLPGFALHSVWSGMGKTRDGRIFVALSNHDEAAGNVALFELDPVRDRMVLLGDIRSVSMEASNWQADETQFKVHTFLQEHGDGLVYFGSMPTNFPAGERGGHLYRMNPKTGAIQDVSATAPKSLNAAGDVVNWGGVFAAEQGIKGIGLAPSEPGVLYLMLHDSGGLYRYGIEAGEIEKIGQSSSVSYVFHVDDAGDVYYLGGAGEETQDLLRFDAATGKTTALRSDLPMDEVGMIVPVPNGPEILLLLAKSKKIFRIDTVSETIRPEGKACGRNWWKLFNMSLSPDGSALYFVSNNNDNRLIWRKDLASGACSEVLDVNAVLGTRNLAFGGQQIWAATSFFTPVWTHEGPNDVAILKITIE